jgi:hypothetical protein
MASVVENLKRAPAISINDPPAIAGRDVDKYSVKEMAEYPTLSPSTVAIRLVKSAVDGE